MLEWIGMPEQVVVIYEDQPQVSEIWAKHRVFSELLMRAPIPGTRYCEGDDFPLLKHGV